MDLSAEKLLVTTRCVRKRLDMQKPVALELVRECIQVAIQAPTGGNTQQWQFVVVADEAKRAELAELYRKAWSHYRAAPGSVYELFSREPEGAARDQFHRVIESAEYLVDNLQRVPVHVIPCIKGRVDKMAGPGAGAALAAVYGSILPATWSYMLAARCRGLGTAWTTAHLMYE